MAANGIQSGTLRTKMLKVTESCKCGIWNDQWFGQTNPLRQFGIV